MTTWQPTPPEQAAELAETAVGRMLEARGRVAWMETLVEYQGRRVWVTRAMWTKEGRCEGSR